MQPSSQLQWSPLEYRFAAPCGRVGLVGYFQAAGKTRRTRPVTIVVSKGQLEAPRCGHPKEVIQNRGRNQGRGAKATSPGPVTSLFTPTTSRCSTHEILRTRFRADILQIAGHLGVVSDSRHQGDSSSLQMPNAKGFGLRSKYLDP